jgi:hypothetical protein
MEIFTILMMLGFLILIFSKPTRGRKSK